MSRYAPAAAGIRSVPRIRAAAQNGRSRHVPASPISSSGRRIKHSSGLLIRGFGVRVPGGARIYRPLACVDDAGGPACVPFRSAGRFSFQSAKSAATEREAGPTWPVLCSASVGPAAGNAWSMAVRARWARVWSGSRWTYRSVSPGLDCPSSAVISLNGTPPALSCVANVWRLCGIPHKRH